jgi:hypothetical protein
MSAVGCKRTLERAEYLTVVIKSRVNQSRKNLQNSSAAAGGERKLSAGGA